jgi:hypothetical protein
LVFGTGHEIAFAHTSFKWANLASHNAGVTVAIVAISNHVGAVRKLFALADDGGAVVKEAANINAYLVAAPNVAVTTRSRPFDDRAIMQFGNHPYYGSSLIFSHEEGQKLVDAYPEAARLVRPLYGSREFISAAPRACLWIEAEDFSTAMSIPPIEEKMRLVAKARKEATRDKAAQKLAETPYRFRDQVTAEKTVMAVPRVSSENRPYLPVGILPGQSIMQDAAFALYDAQLWNMALIASRLHLVWIATVCGKLKTDFRYSNTLGWNTFPVPKLTEKNEADLTACAEDQKLCPEGYGLAADDNCYPLAELGAVGDSAGFLKGLECGPARLGLCGMPKEGLPATGTTQGDSFGCDKRLEGTAGRLIFFLFFGAELNGNAHRVVVREEVSGELGDALLVDDVSKHLDERSLSLLVCIPSGGESESVWCNG